MQMFTVAPTLYYTDTFKEFFENFDIKETDLIITNSWIYEPYLKPYNEKAHVIFQEKYGAGEPTDTMIDAIVKDASEYTYDRIIAVGGGTVIDISKVLALKVPEKSETLFKWEVPFVREKELIVIPTTCGTGSEVTNVSVAEITSLCTKRGIAADVVYANVAVLIPECLQGLPDQVFATSSIDALIHAVEAYLSPDASPHTDVFAEKAIKMLIEGYLKMFESDDPLKTRNSNLKDFCLAANFAGIAFGNAGVGPVHALSYALSGAFHFAHGDANYQLFTAVLKKYLEKAPDGKKLNELNTMLAELLKCEVSVVYEELDNLLAKLIAKKQLRDCGMVESQAVDFTEMTLQNQGRLLATEYVHLTNDDMKEIFASLY